MLFFHQDKVCRAHLEGIVSLRGRVRNSNDGVGAHGPCKHNAEMTEATDSYDSHAATRSNFVSIERTEDRQACAQHGRCVLRLNAFRDRKYKLLVRANGSRVAALCNAAIWPAAVVRIDHISIAITHTIALIIVLACVTVHARSNLRANAHSVTDLDIKYISAHFCACISVVCISRYALVTLPTISCPGITAGTCSGPLYGV